MYGVKELKQKIQISKDEVECPVIGCTYTVPKTKRDGPNLSNNPNLFVCKTHKIFITRNTFVYENEKDNLLWTSNEDAKLLSSILGKGVKRETRFSHDNSEDAVTWNVFRYIEKCNLVNELLSGLRGKLVSNSEIVYWSYSGKSKGVLPELQQSRTEFGEKPGKDSEPDIIAISDDAVFFIEAKLKSPNVTPTKKEELPSKLLYEEKYVSGGSNWFSKVFASSYLDIIKKQKYELMRFWLLGSWIAEQSKKDFYLVNLVPMFHEQNIENEFKPLIKENSHRKFLRLTWENLYAFIVTKHNTADEELFTNYFLNKTIGYNNGNLQKAFFVDHEKIIVNLNLSKKEKEEMAISIKELHSKK